MWYNINRTGRLGNRLFSRAHVYAAALEFGETVIDWGLSDIKNHFPNLAKTKLPIYPLNQNGELPDYPKNYLANEISSDAETTAVGFLSATSSAWLGPDSVTIFT